ncbi:hypothetical protein [Shewanella nanhaiensis]|uniref:Uncharacterized protein n=1 Tax=Shewanella nanhaiensis TaxID=2864872 RepID=A0ABS7E2G4_9GAMM|nr:hypothetical protein [Shewanella nanhaiensis]MBW8183207.1 hypothetical protein [Shewanella nanhaiensis]
MRLRIVTPTLLLLFCIGCTEESELSLETEIELVDITLLELVGESIPAVHENKLEGFPYPTRVIELDKSEHPSSSPFDRIRVQTLVKEQKMYSILADKFNLNRDECLSVYRSHSKTLEEQYSFILQKRQIEVSGEIIEIDDGYLSPDNEIKVDISCTMVDSANSETFTLRLDNTSLSALAKGRLSSI